MQRGPMPVFDHVGARRRMRVDNQAKLSGIFRILRARIPSDGLGVGFGDEIVRVLERASEIARKPDTAGVEAALRLEIRVLRDYIEAARDRPLVQVGVDAT